MRTIIRQSSNRPSSECLTLLFASCSVQHPALEVCLSGPRSGSADGPTICQYFSQLRLHTSTIGTLVGTMQMERRRLHTRPQDCEPTRWVSLPCLNASPTVQHSLASRPRASRCTRSTRTGTAAPAPRSRRTAPTSRATRTWCDAVITTCTHPKRTLALTQAHAIKALPPCFSHLQPHSKLLREPCHA